MSLFINGYAMPLNEEGRNVRLEPFRQVVATHDGDGDGKISKEEAPEGLVRNVFSFFDLAKRRPPRRRGLGVLSSRRSTPATASSPSSCRKRACEEI